MAVRGLSGGLLALLLLQPVAARAQGEQVGSYVALGDSISSGYGLEAEELRFPRQVAGGLNLELTALAQNGETSQTLRNRLQDPEVAAAISQAQVITITVGGNDFMNALYAYVYHQYQAANQGTALTQEEVKEAVMGGDVALLTFAVKVVSGFSGSQEEKKAVSDVVSNLLQVMEEVESINPKADVVLVNQYDPYRHLVQELSRYPLVAHAAQQLSEAFETGVSTLNTAIAAVGEQTGCTVVDVYTAFAQAGENPCNASVSAPMKLNLDFHPNSYGHSLIAQTVMTALDQHISAGSTQLQTVNGEVANITQKPRVRGQWQWAIVGSVGLWGMASVVWQRWKKGKDVPEGGA